MKGKSKLWLFTGAGILLVAAAIVLTLTLRGGESGWSANTRPPEMGETAQLATREQPSGEKEEPQPTATEQTEKPEQPVTQPTEGKPEPTESKPPEGTTPQQTESPYLEIPYEIPGTSLVLSRLDSYEGIFVEQGTDIHKDNVAMILLLNEGTEAVEYAILTVTMADGTVLVFEPTCLPAGGKMVVQENTGKAFPGGEILKCTGETATLSAFPMSEDWVKVTENENSTLTITNITDQTIPAVRVFYKLYMAEDDGFVGGITYMAKVENLAPGASTTVRPTHYLYGSCKVVMVRVYDTAD